MSKAEPAPPPAILHAGSVLSLLRSERPAVPVGLQHDEGTWEAIRHGAATWWAKSAGLWSRHPRATRY